MGVFLSILWKDRKRLVNLTLDKVAFSLTTAIWKGGSVPSIGNMLQTIILHPI